MVGMAFFLSQNRPSRAVKLVPVHKERKTAEQLKLK